MPRVESETTTHDSHRDQSDGRDALVGFAALGLLALCAVLAAVVIMPRLGGAASPSASAVVAATPQTPSPTIARTPTPTPATHLVMVDLVLSDSAKTPSIAVSGGECYGKGGYSDLKAGGSVILRDEKGTILGSTTLSIGMGSAHECRFIMSMPDVTDSAAFYVIEVTHRGQISKSHAEMASDYWVFELTIGS
jgi:hypothetical protein